MKEREKYVFLLVIPLNNVHFLHKLRNQIKEHSLQYSTTVCLKMIKCIWGKKKQNKKAEFVFSKESKSVPIYQYNISHTASRNNGCLGRPEISR